MSETAKLDAFLMAFANGDRLTKAEAGLLPPVPSDMLPKYAEMVRLIWVAPDHHGRRVAVFILRRSLYTYSGDEPCLFDDALERLDRLCASGLTRICRSPECRRRHFIASRVTQILCGSKCAGFFQREAKRNWWRTHGAKWRAQRGRA